MTVGKGEEGKGKNKEESTVVSLSIKKMGFLVSKEGRSPRRVIGFPFFKSCFIYR